jgi:hypothetical protein
VGALRGEKPITKVRIWNGTTPWLITRHADQRALLTDPRVSNDDHEPPFPHVNAHRAAIAPHTPKLITNTDAPEHTRLRVLDSSLTADEAGHALSTYVGTSWPTGSARPRDWRFWATSCSRWRPSTGGCARSP